MEESKLQGGYLVTPRVPQGLAAVVEGLTREVIRNAPEDIYVFAAHHFEKLLQLRERCGTEQEPRDGESSRRTVREISQALRMRESDHYGPARIGPDQFGWSLNQTAKVLKRHRSIFGEAGRRISTDEVFQMANQKENFSQLASQRRRSSKPETSNDLWKTSTSRTDQSWSNEESSEVRRSGPRIITQIPNLQSSTGLLAKDIKAELRRNRISSRERRNVRSKPEDRTSIDKTEAKTGTKGSGRSFYPKKSSERQKRPEAEVEKRTRRSGESSRSSKDRQRNRGTLESRAFSMDRVKDYVVQKFATTKSLEELQTLTYVEKVQGIIDETGPIIKGKVEELKSGMIGKSKRSSWFATGNADPQKDSNGSVNGKGSKDKVCGHRRSEGMSEDTVDALGIRLTETQQLLENVSSKMGKPRRSRSARSSQRSITTKEEMDLEDSSPPVDNALKRRLASTKYQLENISSALFIPMRRSSSAKSLRRQEEIEECVGDALKMRLDETKNLLEEISASFATPGHRGRREKAFGNVGTEENSFLVSPNTSQVSLPVVRSVSAKTSSSSVSRSDSDHLVLPAISPEAPKSKKVKEDLVLPVLSPPGTGSSNTGSKIGEETDDFAEEDIPEIPLEDYEPEPIVDDAFKDSLNVTPDFDSIPQRPDSLDSLETAEEIEAKPENLEERLQEIQRVQKDIEKVFTMKKSENVGHADEHQGSLPKNKSLELDEAEKKIERISDSVTCEGRKEVKRSVEAVDQSIEKNAKEEVTKSRENGSEVDKRIEEETKDSKPGRVNVSVASPETLNYTYVMTEGSPHDIPDTVTTVIIPERTLSPESEEEDVKLSPVFEGLTRKDITLQVHRKSDDKSPTIHNNPVSTSPKIGPKEGEHTSKNAENLFGELIEHEPMESVSPDIDFIRGIESRQEVRMTYQDLVPINEEISEDLEGPEEHRSFKNLLDEKQTVKEAKKDDEAIKTPKTVEAIEKHEEEVAVSLDDLLSEDEITIEVDNVIKKTPEIIEAIEETREEVMEKVTDSPKMREEIEDGDVRNVEVDNSKSRTGSELSPEVSRPHFDSESSNEAKESSGLDEPLESAKCPNSVDEEESSDSRSPESSNEVKETTLTDGFSLSLDPTRPFVPDLNLDSLQDLTVSSFKMTEDEYDNQGHVESGNTNSITDTLASDENQRLIENAEEVEYVVSSSDRSKLEESGYGQEEIVEKVIVKSQVEIKEDLCVKSSAYVTGPSTQGECLVGVYGKITEAEQSIHLGEKEEIEKIAEDVKLDKSEGGSLNDRETISGDKNVDEEMENMAVRSPLGDGKVVIAAKGEDDKPTESPCLEVKKKEKTQEDIVEQSKTEVADFSEDNGSAEGETEAKTASLEAKNKEVINDDNTESLEASVTEVINAGNDKMEDQTTPSGDLSGEIQSVESDETIEESFVEEETPLAVSRSASQCTTRRVSSGNLARLREDPTLGWMEETEQEIGTEEDASAAKVKFSKIGGETIKEQGSDELEPISASPESASGDTTGNMTKDSREYHIYVPEVDAREDKSSTESSTVKSAVTKIQAGVRGFLTRRRIHRGQHNRSSTLNSIPSIQDSIAVEYHFDDEHVNGTEAKISSRLNLDEPGLENAVTTIQNNFRAYKARNRLRREDAIQRTTFSLDKSFAESGLQHTGEFHDCIPLPIHDITMKKKMLSSSDIKRVPTPKPSGTNEIILTTIKDNPENLGQMFFGQSSSNMPLIKFGMTPNIDQLVDLVVQAKEEAELQSGYLNFITSVEDNETIAREIIKTAFSDVNYPHESLKEPLALSVTPLGVVIEEVSNSDADRYLNLVPETATVAPEIKSLGSQRASCASSETITESTDKIEMKDSDSKVSETPETREASGKDKESQSLPTKSSIERLGILECSSLPLGKDLLPESSVDSMEYPVIGSEDKSSSDFEGLEKPLIPKEHSADKKTVDMERNSSTEFEVMKEDESFVSNEASSTLSFSTKVEDLLGFGAEESLKVRVRKPIFEVTLTPADIMKLMSSSHESQLAGERIESPITMVQMAPARAESLLLEESGVDEEKPTNMSSRKSGHDQPS